MNAVDVKENKNAGYLFVCSAEKILYASCVVWCICLVKKQKTLSLQIINESRQIIDAT